MPRLTVSERLRLRLKRLLKPHGTAAALARYSRHSPGGSRISTQELSFFLNPQGKRRGINIDDLDDLSAFFGLSIGELLGETKIGNLSGDEQRMVYAFRALPPAVQQHVLALLDLASLAPRVTMSLPLRPATKGATTSALSPASEAHHGRSISGPAGDPAAALAELITSLTPLADALSDAIARALAHQSAAGAVPDAAPDRRVAD